MARWSTQRRQRGGAALELALTLPLFVTLLLFGMYLTELVRAKLRLQEASRFLAWELTAHPLSDYGGGDPAVAFEAARREAVSETTRRYRDLDSAEEVAPRGFGVTYGDFDARLSDEEAPLPEPSELPPLQGDGGVWSQHAVALARQSARASLRAWGFDLRGHLRADVSLRLHSTLLPVHFLDGERGFFREALGARLGDLRLRSHLVILADGWQLPDGADATIAGGRAGNHRGGRTESGLHRQVRRMRFWGDDGFADAFFLTGVRGLLPLSLPDLSGAFVVSHNYGLDAGRGCEGIPGYPDPSGAADARGGLSNLKGLVDYRRPMCFDTAPARDTQAYASSLYLRMFAARGPYFMGCQRAQAGDPSSPRDRDRGDRDLRRVDCEVSR